MNILVACEESQAVTIELRKLGHRAFSCDIQDCSGGHPEWHIKGDVLPLLDGRCKFKTVDGAMHGVVGKWDMIIAFPPCTYLTIAGAANIPRDPTRIEKGFQAKEFLEKILSADCPRIAVENPIPMKRFELPRYTQILRLYHFGIPLTKSICLWLKGLPLLKETNIVIPQRAEHVWEWNGKRKSCSKWYNTNTSNHSLHRSKTFPEVARAMAEQWAGQADENRRVAEL